MVLYHLMKQPECMKLLQAELDEALPVTTVDESLEDINPDVLAHLPYLNACISEGLRLHPAVASGAQRLAPAGGILVAGSYVPEGTVISIVNVFHLFCGLGLTQFSTANLCSPT